MTEQLGFVDGSGWDMWDALLFFAQPEKASASNFDHALFGLLDPIQTWREDGTTPVYLLDLGIGKTKCSPVDLGKSPNFIVRVFSGKWVETNGTGSKPPPPSIQNTPIDL